MSRRLTLLAVLVLSALVATALALLVTGRLWPGPEVATDRSSLPPSAVRVSPASFLERYVDGEGRVVRRDEGGDTVSEGQAYAMLLALGSGDRETFDRVWSWTRRHLIRDDGLVSWRWTDGRVADPSSAADADLDIARALVVAGQRFEDPAYTEAGVRLGTAILDHETVNTPQGLVLVAGTWAVDATPHPFNPSYVSPVATRLLAQASDDPRWEELDRGSRAAVQELTGDGRLPPDWARIVDDGSVEPMPAPSGQPVQFGYDAARTLLRHAESCRSEDRRLAAADSALLGGDPATVAVYDLAGSPQTDVRSPLSEMAKAAGLAAAGDEQSALRALARAGETAKQSPTYYGDAWAALGPMLLSNPALGGCPPLERR